MGEMTTSSGASAGQLLTMNGRCPRHGVATDGGYSDSTPVVVIAGDVSYDSATSSMSMSMSMSITLRDDGSVALSLPTVRIVRQLLDRSVAFGLICTYSNAIQMTPPVSVGQNSEDLRCHRPPRTPV